jgi:nucleotide-binding universal stress UspA family protein
MTDIPKISRVLVGVDFDDASAAALTMAAALASAWTAELTVFHAVTEAVPAYFTASQFAQLEAEREQSRAAVAEQLRMFAERQVATPVHVVVGEGPAQDAIVRLAPTFDLVVSWGHTGGTVHSDGGSDQ